MCGHLLKSSTHSTHKWTTTARLQNSDPHWQSLMLLLDRATAYTSKSEHKVWHNQKQAPWQIRNKSTLKEVMRFIHCFCSRRFANYSEDAFFKIDNENSLIFPLWTFKKTGNTVYLVMSDSQFTRNKANTPIAQELHQNLLTGVFKASGCYNDRDLAHRTVKAIKLKFCTKMFAFATEGKYSPRVKVKLELMKMWVVFCCVVFLIEQRNYSDVH